MFDLTDRDSQSKLNSATKYPSIPTFHEMDLKTGLLDPGVQVDFKDQLVNVTEKIDGTNARIVMIPGSISQDGLAHWVIGSRESLLACDQDWFPNPELGIVAELWATAEDLLCQGVEDRGLRVYFFEVYGGSVGQNGKQYAKDKEAFGHRLFDVVEFDDELFAKTMSHGREEISGWRQRGNQPFVGWDRFLEIAQETNLERVPIIERSINPAGICFDGLENTLETLREWFPDGSEATLDPGALGRSEGVVFKSLDRKTTAKLRFQDYESSIRRIAKQKIKDGIVE